MKEQLARLMDTFILPKFGKSINGYKITYTWYGLRVSLDVNYKETPVDTFTMESEVKSLFRMLGPEEDFRVEVDFY